MCLWERGYANEGPREEGQKNGGERKKAVGEADNSGGESAVEEFERVRSDGRRETSPDISGMIKNVNMAFPLKERRRPRHVRFSCRRGDGPARLRASKLLLFQILILIRNSNEYLNKVIVLSFLLCFLCPETPFKRAILSHLVGPQRRLYCKNG